MNVKVRVTDRVVYPNSWLEMETLSNLLLVAFLVTECGMGDAFISKRNYYNKV